MYSKRAFDILRASISKNSPLFTSAKSKCCKSAIKKSSNIDFRNDRSYVCLHSSTSISTRSICQSALVLSVHTTDEDVIKEKNIGSISESEVESENVLSSDPPVEFETISAALQKCVSVEEQLEKLCTMLRLEPKDIQSRFEVCKSIETIVSPFFKDYHVQMYGSSVNGFGLKGCDIDMSFSCAHSKKKLMSYSDDVDIPLVEDVISGKVSVQEISELCRWEQLLFIHTALLRHFKETSEPIIFINAFVPIIRFHTEKPKLQCDLSHGNRVAYANTKLLDFYGHLDKRVTPLMIAIRFWAKHVGLCGKGLMFNSYTMSLLLIYFLQTRSPPVLPTVEDLGAILDALTIQDMKDNSYLKDISKIPQSENKQTTEELLKEFFSFYAYFDYSKVILPLNGTAVPTKDFFPQNPKFRISTISIQDPFKLIHNVANLVDFKHCKLFVNKLLMCVKLCHDETLWSPNSSKWGFMSILEPPADYTVALSADDSHLCFKFLKPLNTFEKSQSNENEAWLQQVSRAVLDVLEYGLLFKCTLVDKSNVRKQSKIEEGQLDQTVTRMSLPKSSRMSGVSSDVQNVIMTAECIAYEKTWLGREDMKMADTLHDPLEMEHVISSKLCNSESDKKKKALFHFICECSASENAEGTCVLVKFQPIRNTDFNPIVGLFLMTSVPKMVNRVLQTSGTKLLKHQSALNRS